jgi:hypothetical protein
VVAYVNAKQMMVERLQRGETIHGYREGGNSMTPIIRSRQPVDIYPLPDNRPVVGDVVFCKVHGKYFMHLVKAIDGNRVQIGNNHGHINGWTTREKVYGIVAVPYTME